jgi:hypothetical protein
MNTKEMASLVVGRDLTREDVLTAIVAGDRTKQQIADRFGVVEPSMSGTIGLSVLLGSLVCDDLVYMQVVDAAWHHMPTKAGRSKAAQEAIKAVTDRLRK